MGGTVQHPRVSVVLHRSLKYAVHVYAYKDILGSLGFVA
jgi:hypothetical protein